MVLTSSKRPAQGPRFQEDPTRQGGWDNDHDTSKLRSRTGLYATGRSVGGGISSILVARPDRRRGACRADLGPRAVAHAGAGAPQQDRSRCASRCIRGSAPGRIRRTVSHWRTGAPGPIVERSRPPAGREPCDPPRHRHHPAAARRRTCAPEQGQVERRPGIGDEIPTVSSVSRAGE